MFNQVSIPKSSSAYWLKSKNKLVRALTALQLWMTRRTDGPSAVRKYRASIICSITTMLAPLFMRSGGAPVFPPSWCEITNHSTPAPCLSSCALAFVVKWPVFMLGNKNDCSYYSFPVLIMPLRERHQFSWLLKYTNLSRFVK